VALVPLHFSSLSQTPATDRQTVLEDAYFSTQAPLWHSSGAWQSPTSSPVLHPSPSAFAGFEQKPVAGLHVPALWH
jgi:hypothetical protein